MESRERQMHFVHWNRIHYFLVTDTIFLFVLCILCVFPGRLWDNCNILQVPALIKDFTWIFDAHFYMYGSQDFIVGKPFFNSCWYFNYPGVSISVSAIWGPPMPILCITLNNDARSDEPSFWRRRGLREGLSDTNTWYPHCRRMQGCTGHRALLLSLGVHPWSKHAHSLLTSPVAVTWQEAAFRRKGLFCLPVWRYSQHGGEGMAEGSGLQLWPQKPEVTCSYLGGLRSRERGSEDGL